MRVLRWILILPACVGVWMLSAYGGAWLIEAAQRLCPENQIQSGMCMAPWFRWLELGIMVGSTAATAALIVAAAWLLAPDFKRQVAWIVYVLGALVAFGMAAEGGLWAELAGALIGGGLVALRLAGLPGPSRADAAG